MQHSTDCTLPLCKLDACCMERSACNTDPLAPTSSLLVQEVHMVMWRWHTCHLQSLQFSLHCHHVEIKGPNQIQHWPSSLSSYKSAPTFYKRTELSWMLGNEETVTSIQPFKTTIETYVHNIFSSCIIWNERAHELLLIRTNKNLQKNIFKMAEDLPGQYDE